MPTSQDYNDAVKVWLVRYALQGPGDLSGWLYNDLSYGKKPLRGLTEHEIAQKLENVKFATCSVLPIIRSAPEAAIVCTYKRHECRVGIEGISQEQLAHEFAEIAEGFKKGSPVLYPLVLPAKTNATYWEQLGYAARMALPECRAYGRQLTPREIQQFVNANSSRLPQPVVLSKEIWDEFIKDNGLKSVRVGDYYLKDVPLISGEPDYGKFLEHLLSDAVAVGAIRLPSPYDADDFGFSVASNSGQHGHEVEVSLKGRPGLISDPRHTSLPEWAAHPDIARARMSSGKVFDILWQYAHIIKVLAIEAAHASLSSSNLSSTALPTLGAKLVSTPVGEGS
jgi:hypothetical protein